MTMTSDLEKLVTRAMKIGRVREPDAVVRAALREYITRHKSGKVTRRKKPGILKWMGKIDFIPGYDPKDLRRRESAVVKRTK